MSDTATLDHPSVRDVDAEDVWLASQAYAAALATARCPLFDDVVVVS